MKEIYQVLAGMMGHETRMTQIANNLSNVNTPGYKKDRVAFVDFFQEALKNATETPDSVQNDWAANPAVPKWPVLGEGFLDLSSGPLKRTGRDLDVAIEEAGYFQIEVDGFDDPFYTRAGNFRLNDKGQLVTASGHRVLDESGRPITMELNGERPTITGEGSIRVGDAEVARLGIVRFEKPELLGKHGYGLMHAPKAAGAEQVERPQLRQGMLEGANVNPIEEMIQMIQTQRAYETNQRVIQTIDEIATQRIRSAKES